MNPFPPLSPTWDYIQKHADEDVRELALRGCPNPEVDMRFALTQIEGRQRARVKLPDLYSHEGILYPPTVSMEQCSSTATANYKASLLQGVSIADLTGGFGIDTMAFTRHFGECHYVEPQATLCALMEHNARVLGIYNLHIHNKTLEEALPELPIVDHIFLDPSRRDAHGGRVVRIEDCQPDLLRWKSDLLSKARKGVLVKLSPMIDLRQVLRELPETCAIHVIAVRGECKEVLFQLSHTPRQEINILSADIRPEGNSLFPFTLREEEETIVNPATTLGRYLFEPNAAILKAGAFRCIAKRFDIRPLHAHTHLYTAEEIPERFPGRVFRILNVFPANKKSIKTNLADIKQANIAVRNFPLSSDQLRQRLHLDDGGEHFLFGVTLHDRTHALILCQREILTTS